MIEVVVSNPRRLFRPCKCFPLNSLTAKTFTLDKTAFADHPPVSPGFAHSWFKPGLGLKSNTGGRRSCRGIVAPAGLQLLSPQGLPGQSWIYGMS